MILSIKLKQPNVVFLLCQIFTYVNKKLKFNCEKAFTFDCTKEVSKKTALACIFLATEKEEEKTTQQLVWPKWNCLEYLR